MAQHVAFLRAVNVAGHASVKMVDVCSAFESAGCRNVRFYIQSGNILFEAPSKNAALLARVATRLEPLIGKEPEIMVRTAADVARIVQRAPFGRLHPSVKLYVAFLAAEPRALPALPIVSSKEALEVVAIDNRDAFIVSRRKKNGMYGFPNNFIEQQLGVAATIRNWSTVTKIAEMCELP